MMKLKEASRKPTHFTSKTRLKGPNLKIIPLGGLEEIGRNMVVIEYERDIVIIDMGLQFPEENMPGIDYIIPNISYLKGKEKNIRGVLITHAHLDHIGAIPHILPRIGNPPVFTARLSAAIIERRHQEYPNLASLNIKQVDETSQIKLGKFQAEFFRASHSIPDSLGVVVKTPVGAVVHTGDFKFDHSPIYDKPADMARIARIGGEGVLALMSESTNAQDKGYQISETEVSKDLEQIFKDAQGRIISATFSSLLNRVQQLIALAEKYGRRVYIDGRSMTQNVEMAHRLKYLTMHRDTIITNPKAFNKLPPQKALAIVTGSQGEENAVLMRLANQEHRTLAIRRGDTVIFSSSVIPGNENSIQKLKDSLYRLGAEVKHNKMLDIHAGGHGKEEDLKLMIRLINPKYFIPVHGCHFQLGAHTKIAEQLGMDPKNIFLADNGQVMEFNKTRGILTPEKVPADYVMVDGLGIGDVSNIVLRDRQMLADDGMCVIIATVDGKSGNLVGDPDVISRGFVYMKESKELIRKTKDKVKNILQTKDPRRSAGNDAYMQQKIRNDIGQFLFNKTQRRPMVLPVIVEV